MKLNLILTSIILASIDCVTQNDFCFQTDLLNNCEGKYNYQCGVGLCSTDRHSCQSIRLWSALNNHFKNEKQRNNYFETYNSFILKINDCPAKIKIEWSKNDVCITGNNCYKKLPSPYRLHSQKLEFRKRVECDCIGVYKLNCGNGFCAVDQKACFQMPLSNIMNATLYGISKCNNDYRCIKNGLIRC